MLPTYIPRKLKPNNVTKLLTWPHTDKLRLRQRRGHFLQIPDEIDETNGSVVARFTCIRHLHATVTSTARLQARHASTRDSEQNAQILPPIVSPKWAFHGTHPFSGSTHPRHPAAVAPRRSPPVPIGESACHLFMHVGSCGNLFL